MHMLYNSDSYVVVQIDASPLAGQAEAPAGDLLGHGGYEIVDKFARKGIYLEGALAQTFRQGVNALIEAGPSEEAMDEYIAGYTVLAQQPLVMH